MRTLSRPRTVVDAPDAAELQVLSDDSGVAPSIRLGGVLGRLRCRAQAED